MTIISKRIIRDAADAEVAIVGAASADKPMHEVIVESRHFRDTRFLKLTGLFHAVQSGLVLLLYWEGEDDHAFLMPVEGRGILDLSRFGGLENPRLPGSTGNILLISQGTGHFALTLEFSKQRV